MLNFSKSGITLQLILDVFSSQSEIRVISNPLPFPDNQHDDEDENGNPGKRVKDLRNG